MCKINDRSNKVLSDEQLNDVTGGGNTDGQTYPQTTYCKYCGKDVYFSKYQEKQKHMQAHYAAGDQPVQ